MAKQALLLDAKLAATVRKDPLAFGITFVDLLEGKEWEVSSRKWMIEPYLAVNPYNVEKSLGGARTMSVTKSTQAGISTMAITKALHFATQWPSRIMYTLPRLQDVSDFTLTRLDPVIGKSQYLRSRLGAVNSSHAKEIGDSYIFITETTTEARMMPVDFLFVDEIDLSDQDNIATLLNRLDASAWGMVVNLSTPTIAGYGIHKLYEASDKRVWMVPCPHCGHRQPMDWEKNLRVIGARERPDAVYYFCLKCEKEIKVPDMQAGEWVPEFPYKSDVHVGYHISQMLTTPAPNLYGIFIDPATKISEFYRKRLGKPYEIGGGSVDRDTILSSCYGGDTFPVETLYSGSGTYYLGVDQGNELQAVIIKKEPDRDTPKVVYTEIISQDIGFERIHQLIRIFRIKKGVIDADPNRHDATEFTKQYPGKILIADYVDQQKVSWNAKKLNNSASKSKSVLNHVTIQRTMAFDELFEEIREQKWQMAGEMHSIPPEIENLISQVTALKRDLEVRKTAGGEREVAIYRKLRPDHLGHAWSYARIAMQVDRGKNLRVEVLKDGDTSTVGKLVYTLQDHIAAKPPHGSMAMQVIQLLSEVPQKQLQFLVEHNYDLTDVSDIPFPLSFKFGLIIDQKISGQAIQEACEWLLTDWRIKEFNLTFR